MSIDNEGKFFCHLISDTAIDVTLKLGEHAEEREEERGRLFYRVVGG